MPPSAIDVYPVGILADLLRVWRAHTYPNLPAAARRHAWLNLRRRPRRWWRYVRAGQWRELKNTFNGYMAEPHHWPDGLRRCGTGWTRRRALKSLERRARRPGVAWDQLQPHLDEALRRR